MDKQIEEMRNDLNDAWHSDIIIGDKFKDVAEKLTKLGYRKIPEGAVVLTEELDFYKGANRELTEKNAYLKQCADQFLADYQKAQKQVDELTDKLGKVLSGIKMDELLVAKGIEQTVKDTAKEIFTDLLKEFSSRKSCEVACDIVREMVQNKGVEVE